MAADNRGDFRVLLIALAIVVLVLTAAGAVLLPAAAPLVETLNQGLGLRDAVPWGFGVTVALLTLFALVAGDGLLGELQFMLGAFFSFFLILTLLIAWVF